MSTNLLKESFGVWRSCGSVFKRSLPFVPYTQDIRKVSTTSPESPEFSEAPLNVLSIRGGGVKDVFSERVLARLEEDFQNEYGSSLRVASLFDVLSATSSGGQIALSLAYRAFRDTGASSLEGKNTYISSEKDCISTLAKDNKLFFQRKIKNTIEKGEGYEDFPLNGLLEKTIIEDITLRDVPKRVIITVHNPLQKETHVFDSLEARNPKNNYKLKDLVRLISSSPDLPATTIKNELGETIVLSNSDLDKSRAEKMLLKRLRKDYPARVIALFSLGMRDDDEKVFFDEPGLQYVCLNPETWERDGFKDSRSSRNVAFFRSLADKIVDEKDSRGHTSYLKLKRLLKMRLDTKLVLDEEASHTQHLRGVDTHPGKKNNQENENGGGFPPVFDTPQDRQKTKRFLKDLAEKDDAKAQYRLGEMHAEDMYGEDSEDSEAVQNRSEALRWFRRAAEQGFVKAQRNMGLFYQEGFGVDQNDGEAVRWFRKAAEQGDADSQYDLGVAYKVGYGVKQDEREALKWFRRAAEQDFAVAQYRLGEMYAAGCGTVQDGSEAVKWLEKASEQALSEAKYSLGILYQKGMGVDQDTQKAKKWFKKAAEQGHVDAKYRLREIFQNDLFDLK